jgi:hypothetical protein
VDVGVARGTERGCVGLARDSGWSLFTHLAQQDTLVASREEVSGVHTCVTRTAEEGGVGAAVEESSGALARVAAARFDAPTLGFFYSHGFGKRDLRGVSWLI